MRVLFFLLVFQLAFLLTWSQSTTDRKPDTGPATTGAKLKNSRVIGHLLDSKTGKGLQSATVELWLNTNRDTSANSDSLFGTVLSKTNGEFVFSNIPSSKGFRIVISVLGFEKKEIKFDFRDKNAVAKIEKDLGNIEMKESVKQMENVTVVASKPTIQVGIDRTIYNVDKSITSSGGTGLDVMKNIPLLSVDIDGNVQLRNESPKIFVDGRPTILTLRQIPADVIDRVEVITNPSAKYDASGNAGIINIILKKNKSLGLNGIASAGAGTPGIFNAGLNLSSREGKVNYFMGMDYNRSGGKAKGETLRQNKEDGIVKNYFNQHSITGRLRRFESLRFGFDYFSDSRNVFSISQSFVNGKFSSNQHQDQDYLDADAILLYYGKRISNSRSGFNNGGTAFNFNHKFPEEGKELNASINYNYGRGNGNSKMLNSYFNLDGTDYANPEQVNNDSRNNNNQWTFQADFDNPISKNAKFEAGVRSYINNYANQLNSYGYDSIGNPVKLSLSNHYEYREMVNALYALYSGKWKSIGYQFGIRGELAEFDGFLIDSARKFGYETPSKINNIGDALVPSVFFSKQLNDKTGLRLSYTKRIRRPGFGELNPYVEISDPVNLRLGNPSLQPETIHSFELSYNQRYGKGSNLYTVIYYRDNTEDIIQYSDTISAEQYQKLNNAAIDPNAILSTFINGKNTDKVGMDLILQQKITRYFDVTPSFNVQYQNVKSGAEYQELNNEGLFWFGKLVTNYRIEAGNELFNHLSLQLVGQYESPKNIAQGKRAERYLLDFAFRKEFMKNRSAAFTFSVNDILNSDRYGTYYDTDEYYQYSYGRGNVRTFRVGFTYRFGKVDFSLFKKNDKDDDES